MRRCKYAFVLLLWLLSADAFSATDAIHLRMTTSVPAKDTVLTEAPNEIRLWFNQVPQLAVSRISLDGPNGAVDVGDVEGTDDEKSFKAAVNGALSDGAYTVSWRTAGDDGHVMRRSFEFSMRTSAGEGLR